MSTWVALQRASIAAVGRCVETYALSAGSLSSVVVVIATAAVTVVPLCLLNRGPSRRGGNYCYM
jgi:hypothetical protein